MKDGISDKVIIITGAGKGIGRRAAQYLAEFGGRICIADIDYDLARETVALIKEKNGIAMAVACDITSMEDTSKMAKKVLEHYGEIDILINNAGYFPINMFSDMTIEEWKKVIEINLTGTFCAIKPIYQQLRKQGNGKIINVASAAGRVGGVGFAHYSAAKAGVIGLTKALAREGAPLGIQVNAIAPGLIETDTAKSVFPPFALKEFTRNVPMGRLGRENDIIGIIRFLCSEESNYITGQVFAIDGGYTMI